MVVIWVSGYLTSMLGPNAVLGSLLRRMGLMFVHSDLLADLVGWLIVLGTIFGLGVLVELGARRLVYDRFDNFAERIPVLGGIYGTVRQMVGMIDKKGNPDLQRMSVVFCLFGGESGAAFLALLPTPELFRIGDVDYNAVLIPSAPVPVGGSLLFVPATSVRKADLTVDAFMSIYVSMGVSGPQFLKPPAVVTNNAPGAAKT
jgi:uncharacterized membrane protein